MKTKYIIFLVCSLMGLSACQMLEGEGEVVTDAGNLDLSVQVNKPMAVRAVGDVDVNDFEVEIASTAVDGYKASCLVKDLPASLSLPVGDFQVTAHTPGESAKRMSEAYYLGERTLSIKNGVTTQAELVCRQVNSKIQVLYGEGFLSAYSQWTITIDDGGTMALVFDQTDQNPQAVYWIFESQVSELTVNFAGVEAATGAPVKGRSKIRKADANEKYDNDNEFFCGGDAIVLNFVQDMGDIPVTTGSLNGLTITANCTFADEIEEETIPVVWEDDEDGDDDENEDNGGKPTISFTAAAVDATAADGPELNADIQASKGIRSILVKAQSTGGFQAAMIDLQESGLNLLEGHELVGDEVLPAVFEGLGVEASMPSEGDTSYLFNIANFYQFLAIYGAGATTFSIVVEDMEGNKAEGSVIVNIMEE